MLDEIAQAMPGASLLPAPGAREEICFCSSCSGLKG
jgi:hypothetical protein